MRVTIPTFRPKSAGADKDSTIQPIVRKTVALSKSLGPICDLVSTGAVATWIVGVFFGVGFCLLFLHPIRARARVRARDHQNSGPSMQLLEGVFETQAPDPPSEGDLPVDAE